MMRYAYYRAIFNPNMGPVIRIYYTGFESKGLKMSLVMIFEYEENNFSVRSVASFIGLCFCLVSLYLFVYDSSCFISFITTSVPVSLLSVYALIYIHH